LSLSWERLNGRTKIIEPIQIQIMTPKGLGGAAMSEMRYTVRILSMTSFRPLVKSSSLARTDGDGAKRPFRKKSKRVKLFSARMKRAS
ncbi:MAG: hypothetical protein SPL62_10420, partial [Selenomonas sp.]|nr:hypothetical protein [Selenomonas sp.]